MQDWDRIVMILIGAGVSVYTGRDGWKFLKAGRYAATVGVALLILAAIGVPVLLVLFAT